MNQLFKKISVLFITFGLLIFIQARGVADDDIVDLVNSVSPAILYADSAVNRVYTPPPASFYALREVTGDATADIRVNYIGSWSNEARNAFEYAVSIWESQIVSEVPIVVDAEFKSLEAGVLGQAIPHSINRNFTGAPFTNTWYPISLANALRQVDSNGNNPEIVAEFSTNFNWYFGTDGNTPVDKPDFVSVVLHEIGHGLGFISTMRVQGDAGFWGQSLFAGYPLVYDRFLDNGNGTSLIAGFPNGSVSLSNQLRSNNIFFDGVFANSANGGRVQLYAPNPWEPASSIAHLDLNRFQNTPNNMMVPSLRRGEARHNPGPVALGIMRDMGWPPPNQPPVISNLPTQFLDVGQSKTQAIDLWRYVQDDRTGDSQLTFKIVSISDPKAGVTISGNRYININPETDTWAGASRMHLRVTDTEGLSSDGFVTIFAGEVTSNFLPFVLKQ